MLLVIHRWPVDSPHKWPVKRKPLQFDDVIRILCCAPIPISLVRYVSCTEECQFGNFFVTVGTVSCHYDNLRCHQWQQIAKLTIYCCQCVFLIVIYFLLSQCANQCDLEFELDWIEYRSHMMTSWYGHFASWWRHQMESFSALLAICAGNSPVPVRGNARVSDVFLHKWWVMRSFNGPLLVTRTNCWTNSLLEAVTLMWRHCWYVPMCHQTL